MAILKNKRRELFCQAVVNGLTNAQAAVAAGFSEKTAGPAGSRLVKVSEIVLRIEELRGVKVMRTIETQFAGNEKEFVRAQVRDRTYRIAVHEDLVNRHVKLMRDRAEQYAGAPGGDTGLIVRQLKVIGVGKNQREVEEYVYDRALVAELREQLKQAAIETGDWEEKQAHRIEKPSYPEYDNLTVEQLEEHKRILQAEIERVRTLPRPARMIEAAPGTVEELKG